MPRLPEPPRPEDLDPLIADWPAERPFFRVHDRRYGPNQFNASGSGQARFSPLAVDGRIVPALYGSDSLEGALSESVFRFVSTGDRELRARRVPAAALADKVVSKLAARRSLRFVDLRGFGLGGARIPITRAELIESNAAHYSETRPWAEAFYRHSAAADGFLWISRQYDRAECFMLFGDRVGDGLYHLDPPQPLLAGGMLIEVMKIAQLAKIDIISSGYPG
jgi:hypothetical protein